MANMTLAVPDELHERMKKQSAIRWGEVARQAFEQKLQQLEWMDEVLKESKLTEKDAEEIGNKIKRATREHFDALRRGQQPHHRSAP
jgi:hypothetical protein